MTNYPNRKRLRLWNYDYAQKGCYFLTICTKNRKQLLSEIVCDGDGPAVVRLKPYGIIAEQYIKTISGIDKYVIMPNHIHMIIIHESDGRSIAADVRAFKGLATKRIGERIWQDSYYDHIIRNEADYQEKWNYIDANPAKWAEDEYNA